MTPTKREILAKLKRNGGRTVDELAGSLKLAPITVRQHLTALQRDELVKVERRRGPDGRRRFVFQLTARGHATFPRRSDRLAELLLVEVGRLEGCDLDGLAARQKVGLVLQRLAHNLAQEYTPLLQGWRLEERVAFVAEALHADGGFAEWERTEQGYEIRDYNCLFHNLANGNGDLCEWHQSFVSQVLGAEVRAVPCPDNGSPCCRYLVICPEHSQAGLQQPAPSLPEGTAE
jgi:predicted ArsR family transcriptional regulator